MVTPAGPASGKYGGFGSEDLERNGYKAGQFNQPYDPYMKNMSIHTVGPTANSSSGAAGEPEKKKKKKKKAKKVEESSSDDSDSDDSDDSDDSEEEKKKKEKKKNKAAGLSKPEKAGRSLEGAPAPAPAPAAEPNLLDMLDSNPPVQPAQPATASNFAFMGQPAPAQPSTDIFGGMSVTP